MKFNLLHFYALLSLALVVSHAVTPEVYWKSVLPNTPMPKTIKDLLYTKGKKLKPVGNVVYPDAKSEGPSKYSYAAHIYSSSISKNQLKNNPHLGLFFLEKDLIQGSKMSLQFMKDYNIQEAKFLPRKEADSLPFSSKTLPQMYNKFSIKPDSIEAKNMKQTLNICENKGIEGEEKYCATSLESMVDFSVKELGKTIKAISTEVNSKKSSPLQEYKIEVAKKLNTNKVVACHRQSYVYAVFYCHKAVDIKVYSVSLLGVDGTKVKAVAICHMDTAKWNPKHMAFQVLKVTPGSVPICHFIPEDHVVWVPYE